MLRMNLGYVIAYLVRQTRNSNTYTYKEKLTKMNHSMVGTTIWGNPNLKVKDFCCCFHCLLVCHYFVVVSTTLIGVNNLHKVSMGGRSPEGLCCWPDFKTPFSSFFGDREVAKLD